MNFMLKENPFLQQFLPIPFPDEWLRLISISGYTIFCYFFLLPISTPQAKLVRFCWLCFPKPLIQLFNRYGTKATIVDSCNMCRSSWECRFDFCSRFLQCLCLCLCSYLYLNLLQYYFYFMFSFVFYAICSHEWTFHIYASFGDRTRRMENTTLLALAFAWRWWAAHMIVRWPSIPMPVFPSSRIRLFSIKGYWAGMRKKHQTLFASAS